MSLKIVKTRSSAQLLRNEKRLQLSIVEVVKSCCAASLLARKKRKEVVKEDKTVSKINSLVH